METAPAGAIFPLPLGSSPGAFPPPCGDPTAPGRPGSPRVSTEARVDRAAHQQGCDGPRAMSSARAAFAGVNTPNACEVLRSGGSPNTPAPQHLGLPQCPILLPLGGYLHPANQKYPGTWDKTHKKLWHPVCCLVPSEILILRPRSPVSQPGVAVAACSGQLARWLGGRRKHSGARRPRSEPRPCWPARI